MVKICKVDIISLMDVLEMLGVALGLGVLAGVNLYMTVFVIYLSCPTPGFWVFLE